MRTAVSGWLARDVIPRPNYMFGGCLHPSSRRPLTDDGKRSRERRVRRSPGSACRSRGRASHHAGPDIDVRKIRQQLGLSLDEFAAKFALPVGTVREWEQRRRRPEGAARVLLTVIEKDPRCSDASADSRCAPGQHRGTIQPGQEVVRRSKAGGGCLGVSSTWVAAPGGAGQPRYYFRASFCVTRSPVVEWTKNTYKVYKPVLQFSVGC
jgi:putative transcriptional regulator